MIYPFDAVYAQQVLRVHYQYVSALPKATDKLVAKTSGLIAHDRFLARMDSDAKHEETRRTAVDRYGYLKKSSAQIDVA